MPGWRLREEVLQRRGLIRCSTVVAQRPSVLLRPRHATRYPSSPRGLAEFEIRDQNARIRGVTLVKNSHQFCLSMILPPELWRVWWDGSGGAIVLAPTCRLLERRIRRCGDFSGNPVRPRERHADQRRAHLFFDLLGDPAL